jgi:hypothetical protein
MISLYILVRAIHHVFLERVQVGQPKFENLKSKMLQHLKFPEYQHNTRSGKFLIMKLCFMHKIIKNIAGSQWLTSVILATQEAVIGRIAVQGQP